MDIEKYLKKEKIEKFIILMSILVISLEKMGCLMKIIIEHNLRMENVQKVHLLTMLQLDTKRDTIHHLNFLQVSI